MFLAISLLALSLAAQAPTEEKSEDFEFWTASELKSFEEQPGSRLTDTKFVDLIFKIPESSKE